MSMRRWLLIVLYHGFDANNSVNLVDPASSHMLVSKIKPCMCKFSYQNSETADGSVNQSEFYELINRRIPQVTLELILDSLLLEPDSSS
jgi:hypothetical protein